MQSALAAMAEVLEEGRRRALAGDTMRVTDGGIWLATPMGVLARAIPLAERLGLFAARGAAVSVLDAGAGDGRVLLSLAILLAHRPDLRLYGLEDDAALFAAAVANRARLEQDGRFAGVARPRIARGDYFDRLAYAPLALEPRDLHVVFNYPDGNERRLLEWLHENAQRGARLAILSPDRDCALPPWTPVLRSEVPADPGGAEPPWHLVVFEV